MVHTSAITMATVAVGGLLAVGGGATYSAKDAQTGDRLYDLRAAVYQDVTGEASVDADLLTMHDLHTETEANASMSAEAKANVQAAFEDRIERTEDRIARLDAEGETKLAANLEHALEVHIRNYERIFGETYGHHEDHSSSSNESDDSSSMSDDENSASSQDDDADSSMESYVDSSVNGSVDSDADLNLDVDANGRVDVGL